MEGTCELCGWLAAIVSCVSFGTFAVPIKSDASKSCDVDPLVFQSYKTFMCFVTSFFTLPLFQQTLHFTPWGIVSAIFWVPAGVMAIYAVKNAGLAMSQGLWSSIIVLVSFVWGIFVFSEKVKSKCMASVAILIMMCGLWGMSFFSNPVHHHETMETRADAHFESATEGIQAKSSDYTQIAPVSDFDDTFEDNIDSSLNLDTSSESSLTEKVTSESVTKRRWGLAGAVFNGIWGGSIMVPMHFAPPEAGGTGYVVSFAIGALLVTAILWVARFFVELYRSGPDYSTRRALNALPSFYLKVMWKPGCLAGLLWSIGNVASMISVHNLGEGVGYSVTQAAMLCSGLWGIFYFNEVVSRDLKLKWFASAVITVGGILLLSYEHEN
mmetsp:Transcript_19937/g.30182  ORF Transcript_19937/g.30182 Transcript_19937/m.30182 type:complete len:382 (-) Transcript_19937:41-1186(-)